jgi:5'-nucleotidase
MIAVTLVRYAASLGRQGPQKARDGAVAAGGFMGFGLGAMPVGLSVMQRITLQHGAAPRAFLVVTLAASLVQDLINAGVVQTTLSLGRALGPQRMPATLEGQLVVAISSRALFDFEEENRLFEAGDDRAYMQLQLQRLDQPARPGVAFSLVRKLLAFNDGAPGRGGDPLAQRPGLGHARVPLGAALRPAGAARRVHARPAAVALPAAAARQPVPVGQRGRRARGAGRRCARGARLPALDARLGRPSRRGAHRLRRRRGAVRRRGRARVPAAPGSTPSRRTSASTRTSPLPAGPFKPLLLALQRLQREPARPCASAPRWSPRAAHRRTNARCAR